MVVSRFSQKNLATSWRITTRVPGILQDGNPDLLPQRTVKAAA